MAASRRLRTWLGADNRLLGGAIIAHYLLHLHDAFGDALVADGTGPLATGTRVLSIVASLDALVGADRAALDASERRVLPGTHEGVLTSEAVRQIVWHFLAGREVVQSPGHLATLAGSTYGNALTVVAALVGDHGAALDLPLPFSPRLLLR